MSSGGSPGSRRIAPCWSETCLRSRSRSARVSGGSAASRRLSRWPWAAVWARIGLLNCPKVGQGWQWFEIGQIFRVDVRLGGSHGVPASQRLRGGETASDDVPPASDLPVPIATVAVQRNLATKCGFFSLGFDQHVTPRGHVIPIPARHRREVNEIEARATAQNCSVGQFFVVKIAHLEFLFVVFHVGQHPAGRSGPQGRRCSRCSPTAETYS